VPVDFAFLKQRYDYELDRKDKLTHAVSQSAGFLTLLGGVITVMVRGFSYEEAWLTIAFLVPLLLALGVAAVSVFWLSLAFYHQRYFGLPDLASLMKAHDETLLQARNSFMPKHRIVLTDPVDVPPPKLVKFPPMRLLDESKPWIEDVPEGYEGGVRIPWWAHWLVGDPPKRERRVGRESGSHASHRASGASSDPPDRS
jgi:hypothetical protein